MRKLLFLTFIIALTLISCGKEEPNMAVNWDLLDEDCSDISDWEDKDFGAGVSEVSPAGQFRFDTNAGGVGRRIKDIGSYPNIFTVEIKLYHDAIGTFANADNFRVICEQEDQQVMIHFCSDGLFMEDTVRRTEVGTNLVKFGGNAEWQTWRFLVSLTDTAGEGTCDVYLDDSTHNWEKVGTAISCSFGGGSEGDTRLCQMGSTTNDRVTHVDYVKVATGLHIPVLYLDSGIRYRKGDITYSIACEDLTASHKLRFRKGATTVGLPLVATDDPDASPIRIYDGSAVKALVKYT